MNDSEQKLRTLDRLDAIQDQLEDSRQRISEILDDLHRGPLERQPGKSAPTESSVGERVDHARPEQDPATTPPNPRSNTGTRQGSALAELRQRLNQRRRVGGSQ